MGVSLLTSLPASCSCNFVAVSVLDNNHLKTPVCKRNLNEPKDATFDFPIFSSLVHKLGVPMFVVWGAGMISDAYPSLPIDRWFKETAFAFDDPNNKSFAIDLISSHPGTTVSGTIHIKLCFVKPPNSTDLPNFGRLYNVLIWCPQKKTKLVSSYLRSVTQKTFRNGPTAGI
ncbi:hypothetical protein EDB92DRAFT_188087 [Lactarius akahatsu]|uniref:Uncharacterized protein n=1 Tax=Lactarius akahatsu TaxID=416441 RepID=A0AAD4Q657_9AGAM|nr:hypothetical protein EDB92DRAFT_188087 [Lactarius akahatsu]